MIACVGDLTARLPHAPASLGRAVTVPGAGALRVTPVVISPYHVRNDTDFEE